MAEADVAADVVVPAAEVLVDVVVMAVGLVRDAFGGAEVHPARHRLAGVVVEHFDVDPVTSRIDQLHPHPIGRRLTVALDVGPGDLAEFGVSLSYRHGGRRDRGDMGVGGAGRWSCVAGAVAGAVVLDW